MLDRDRLANGVALFFLFLGLPILLCLMIWVFKVQADETVRQEIERMYWRAGPSILDWMRLASRWLHV